MNVELTSFHSDYRGNHILVGLVSANIVIFVLAKWYYIKRNQQKDKKWSKLVPSEQENYLSTTSDTGTKKINVRFAH